MSFAFSRSTYSKWSDRLIEVMLTGFFFEPSGFLLLELTFSEVMPISEWPCLWEGLIAEVLM
jgi:hypothetical protein